MKDRLPLVADLLMEAAHADGRLEGDEKEAVRRLLREVLDAHTLPMDVDFRIDEFDAKGFDRGAATSAFAGAAPELKKRLLELIAAVHAAGLVSLTHTPSPMGFLTSILGRPKDIERPFLLLVVGHPAEGCVVPDIARKPLAEIVDWRV